MAIGIGTVQVKREHGTLVVQGLGKTPRGQNFIKHTVPLGVKSSSEPTFKSNLAAAITEIFTEQAGLG